MLQPLALQTRRAMLWSLAAALALTSVVPVLLQGKVFAAPVITERELQSTTARPSQTTDLTWIFDTTADAGNADYIEIEFCDAPLGTCNTTNTPTLAAGPTGTLSGPWTTTAVTGTTRENGASGGTNNQIQIDKTNADDASSMDELQISLGATDVTNNASANRSYYTRMRIYSDTGTTLEWEGVFAQSTSQTLTVNARVQERLDFCVGADNVDDATSTTDGDTAANNNCADFTGSNVDIGNVESGFNNVSPVAVGNGGDGENGVAMVRTNAVNGVVVDYKSLLETSAGALKVVGATCNAVPSTSGTDQCFNTSTTQGTFTAGTEAFGMTIAGINCGSTTAYSCVFATGTYNLVRDGAYDGDGANTYVADNNQVSGTTTAGYAWDATATADRIASSAGSATKVVDDEAMVLKFAATSGITTPTGSYTVQADFIATATF